MINEVLLVEDLLNGKGVNERCMYQHCYLMSKYFLQQGLDPLTVKEKIFSWATGQNIFLDVTEINVNQIVYRAAHDKNRLRENTIVKISSHDLEEIKKRFDKPKTRKVALAFLCYAKAIANSDNEFNVSLLAFSNWLHLSYSSLRMTYLPELIFWGYLEKINASNKKIYAWDSKAKSNMQRFKFLVNFKNVGEHQLVDNNIDVLYDECFN
nr:hypothetical protein [uncultured Lachnoclostridium sp.]